MYIYTEQIYINRTQIHTLYIYIYTINKQNYWSFNNIYLTLFCICTLAPCSTNNCTIGRRPFSVAYISAVLPSCSTIIYSV